MSTRPLARRVTFYISPDGRVALVDGAIRVQSAAEDSLALLAKLGAGLKK
jgi:peroxiredoxin